MIKKIKFVVLFLVVMIGSGQVSYAATDISACGTISSPGDYVLTNASIIDHPSTCINITASDVTFDGNGFTIDGRYKLNTYGVYVYNSTTNLTNVTVKNLTAREWINGIYSVLPNELTSE